MAGDWESGCKFGAQRSEEGRSGKHHNHRAWADIYTEGGGGEDLRQKQ